MRFSVFGTKIYISFLFSATLCIMILCDKTGLIIPLLISVAVHEAGHLFCMWVLECPPNEIRLIPASVQVVSRFGSSFKKDIWVLVLGPVANIVLFFCTYLNFLIFKNDFVLKISLINLILGAFNLLPFSGLDGGSILKILLSKRLSLQKSELTLKAITLLSAVAMLSLAAYSWHKGFFNPSFFISALYFLISAILFK